MLKDVKTLDELKAVAVPIRNKEKIVVFWPQFNRYQEQAYSLTDEYFIKGRTYSGNNGILAFCEQDVLYVIPYFDGAVCILEQEEFQHDDMFVPFSNREYPVEYKEQWESMIEESKELWEESYRKECLEFAAQIGVTPISQNLLDEVCMLIPEEGILVNHPDKEPERRFPVISGYCCDPFTADHLGRYYVNVKNGIITFINADGIQYVTRSETVHRQLLKNGYRFEKFEEIFSDGEEPADKEVLSCWNKLTIA